MGAGKSTLGRQLAAELSLPFLDIDTYIAEQEGRAISEIFADEGESYFRSLECAALKKFITEDVVIATGGGIIENPNNYLLLNKNLINIWVDTNFNTLYNRIVGDKTRPNAVDQSYSSIKELYNSRCSRYNEIAFIRVNSEESIDTCITFIKNRILAEE
ncbi:shikimate kinase [Macrococcus lamae]|uniref:Shikimate kinase n=2 Tax=Macrococcus lamae TaxID=198484 RepID=A0A4R6BY35_9STAP|nr:shikimate kinase [Macrococcus lamae]